MSPDISKIYCPLRTTAFRLSERNKGWWETWNRKRKDHAVIIWTHWSLNVKRDAMCILMWYSMKYPALLKYPCQMLSLNQRELTFAQKTQNVNDTTWNTQIISKCGRIIQDNFFSKSLVLKIKRERRWLLYLQGNMRGVKCNVGTLSGSLFKQSKCKKDALETIKEILLDCTIDFNLFHLMQHIN